MSRLRLALSTLIVIFSAAGCSDDPTGPAPKTQDFNGTLPLRSSVWHTIMTVQPGVLKVTLTNLSAGPVRLVMGDASNACKPFATNAAATMGTSLVASVPTGTFCVTVADPGQLTAPVSYTLTVTYP